MFDVAPSELLLILIVVVVAIGPKELPAALRQLGIDRLEICSFHIPAHDSGFLAALRASGGFA